MDFERTLNFKRDAVAFDVETHRIQPGLLAPPLVCASIAWWSEDTQRPVGRLLGKEEALAELTRVLRDKSKILVGLTIAYDLLVMAVYAARQGIDLMPLIFAAYEDGRIYDVSIAESLHAIAVGKLRKDYKTGLPLRDPVTGKMPASYNLAVCTYLCTGRINAKENDQFRQSYALLEHIPMGEWPELARTYPVDDVCNTLEDALIQVGAIPNPMADHKWPTNAAQRCTVCSKQFSFSDTSTCMARRTRRRNLHDVRHQVYAHWAMHLGAAWGFVVDQAAADAVETRVTEGRTERAAPFLQAGILRWKKEKGETKLARDMSVIKKLVARAYGATSPCPACTGTGKVASAKSGNSINCKTCGATGYDLTGVPVPMTSPTNEEAQPGVGSGRDVLMESGDELLMGLAEFLEDAKIPESYIPWLREARVEAHDPAGMKIWRNIPLLLRPNPFPLETGRASYSGVVMLLPRKGGIRECIVARKGRVLCSVDYEAGELITHGESATIIVGYSRLAEALNDGVKPHNAFAGTVLGLDYLEYEARLADKKSPHSLVCKDVRQAAKPANFGFPGGMGAAKLVLQQRKQGPDTPCANGPSWIEIDGPGGTKVKVRGYKGLRFCILMDGADRCGTHADGSSNKVNEWKRKPTPPTCKACLECAERLRAKWFKQWPENEGYFEMVGEWTENGQPVEPGTEMTVCELDWNVQTGQWEPVGPLEPGQIVQHGSLRVRGGVQFTNGANGYFQALLADAAKRAFCRIQRECYDVTARVHGAPSPLFGSRAIVFQHDEALAELLEDKAHEAGHRMGDIMCEELRARCPRVKKAVKAKPAISRRWYKSMEPVYRNPAGELCKETDPGARLACWEPEAKAAA